MADPYTELKDELHTLYCCMIEPMPCPYCAGGKDLDEDEACGECEGTYEGPNLVQYNWDQIIDMTEKMFKAHCSD